MITREGPQKWANVHVTTGAKVDAMIQVDNSAPLGTPQPQGLNALKIVAQDLDQLVQEAKLKGKHVRALGSGWALSDLVATDGWLVNTKFLNGCFDVHDSQFDPAFAAARRPNIVLAQCGVSIAELNVYLEVTAPNGNRRALQTSGIGAGQTVAGSTAGNTHGSAIKFGATPDYIRGIQLVTGVGKSWWIERASDPMMTQAFVDAIGATLLRDDDVFNAAAVAFGSFGIITALAIEAMPIYHLDFPPIENLTHATLADRLKTLKNAENDPAAPYHFEFIFNPHDDLKRVMVTAAQKVDFIPGHETPPPVWIVRDKDNFALGTNTAKILLKMPLLSAAKKCEMQFDLYKEKAILNGVRGTPGQVFTATVFYFEGYTEAAIGISIDDAPKMLEISSAVARDLKQPCISQVRLVHPGKTLLGFTNHGPKTCVFEFDLVNDKGFRKFERTLLDALEAAGVKYTVHWSKNSGVDAADVLHMYGADKVNRWKTARDKVFGGDAALKKVFDSPLVEKAGLA
jgi:FAD/FMN-containing dehydrogenase